MNSPRPGGRVEDLLRRAHQAVDVGADLAPDRDPRVLVDVAEAVRVEALVVQVVVVAFLRAGRRGKRRIAHLRGELSRGVPYLRLGLE